MRSHLDDAVKKPIVFSEQLFGFVERQIFLGHDDRRLGVAACVLEGLLRRFGGNPCD